MSKNLDGLDGWLGIDTWHTSHPRDESRFYQAIYKVIKENNSNSINPDDIRSYITSRFDGKLDGVLLKLRAEEAAERFEIINEFVDANEL
ncbi:hypothetical protein [Yersinia frederiksenii]|uniref:hypothetical protein n=1 Tax=Yersinia frederiksenii TaxID=29484 RepID=UPI0005DE8DF1|nr:hypothetical protein [Yersinia frederiksenii]CFR14897.1 Uncharacterised protein [Yersinia frederiksenii]